MSKLDTIYKITFILSIFLLLVVGFLTLANTPAEYARRYGPPPCQQPRPTLSPDEVQRRIDELVKEGTR